MCARQPPTGRGQRRRPSDSALAHASQQVESERRHVQHRVRSFHRVAHGCSPENETVTYTVDGLVGWVVGMVVSFLNAGGTCEGLTSELSLRHWLPAELARQ